MKRLPVVRISLAYTQHALKKLRIIFAIANPCDISEVILITLLYSYRYTKTLIVDPIDRIGYYIGISVSL